MIVHRFSMMTEMSMVILSHSLYLFARICAALPAFEIKLRPHLLHCMFDSRVPWRDCRRRLYSSIRLS